MIRQQKSNGTGKMNLKNLIANNFGTKSNKKKTFKKKKLGKPN